MEEYARLFGIQDQIIFAGRVSGLDLPRFYCSCDVLVTASIHEGVCVPILEAFASGKPVLVPDVTAMPETANGGGVIYRSNSVDDFVDKVRRLQRDETLRLRLGRKGRSIAMRHDIARVSRQYTLHVNDILKR